MARRDKEAAPTFRVGALANRDVRSLAAILDCDREELENVRPSGCIALEVLYSRGNKVVDENSKEEIPKDYSSVSEAIVISTQIDPLHVKGGLAIEDDPTNPSAAPQKTKAAKKRARQRENRGAEAYYQPMCPIFAWPAAPMSR